MPDLLQTTHDFMFLCNKLRGVTTSIDAQQRSSTPDGAPWFSRRRGPVVMELTYIPSLSHLQGGEHSTLRGTLVGAVACRNNHDGTILWIP